MRITLISTLFSILTLLGVGCRENIVWSEARLLPDKQWPASLTIDFNIDPEAYSPPPANRFEEMTSRTSGDTLPRLRGQFKAIVSLRYGRDCNARSVKIVAECNSLDLPTRSDTLYFRLFDDNDNPLGAGHFGLFEQFADLPGIFPVSDGTILSLHPIEYDGPPLEGISSATLILMN